MEDDDDTHSKMIPPRIILMRYKIPKKHEIETSTPVSTDSTTPVLEVKKDRLCDEHGQPIRNIRAHQFSLFRRQNAIDKQLRTIQDYPESHPKDSNYVPPWKKRRDSREDMRTRERKETDSKTRERPSQSTTRKESNDYDSQKYRHFEYASKKHPRKYHNDRDYQREHPSDSKDHQKKIEWASALKRDQLQKKR
uniref:Uncharacterized protein n=1 Tax=Romanomermis culicivorax TaxID=13658 RepID=A0A915JVD8_ROMCU